MMRRLRLLALGFITVFANDVWAFRTAEDTSDFEGAGRVAWPNSAMKYVIHYDTPGEVSFSEFERDVVRAFSTWKAPECAQLAADNGGTSLATAMADDGVNSVQWVQREWSGRGFSSSHPAITDIAYELRDDQWVIAEADLYLNADDYDWIAAGTPGGKQIELRSTLLHEVGHMLGLLHPCELDGDDAPSCDSGHFDETVMHPAYDSDKLALSDDDAAGICYLYPTGECDESCPEGTACVNGDCRIRCGDSTCARNEICFADECHGVEDFCGETLCEDTTVCSEDADCPAAESCDRGVCRIGDGTLGDPCASASDCFSARCADDGYCATPCSEDVHCDAGFSCRGGSCVSKNKGALGEQCSDSNDCLGNQCVADLTEYPVCSRRCGEAFPDCPSNWECELVEGRAVCTPPERILYASGGGACSVGEKRTDGNKWHLGLALLGLVAAMRREKRRSALGRVSKKHGPQRGRS